MSRGQFVHRENHGHLADRPSQGPCLATRMGDVTDLHGGSGHYIGNDAQTPFPHLRGARVIKDEKDNVIFLNLSVVHLTWLGDQQMHSFLKDLVPGFLDFPVSSEEISRRVTELHDAIELSVGVST